MMTAMLAKTSRAPLRSVADDPRWSRIVARDKTADGRFWYSVSTTGVYCRPSCPSRTANPRNVLRVENRVTDYLGTISYGIYMFHMIAVYATSFVFMRWRWWEGADGASRT